MARFRDFFALTWAARHFAQLYWRVFYWCSNLWHWSLLGSISFDDSKYSWCLSGYKWKLLLRVMSQIWRYHWYRISQPWGYRSQDQPNPRLIWIQLFAAACLDWFIISSPLDYHVFSWKCSWKWHQVVDIWVKSVKIVYRIKSSIVDCRFPENHNRHLLCTARHHWAGGSIQSLRWLVQRWSRFHLMYFCKKNGLIYFHSVWSNLEFCHLWVR